MVKITSEMLLKYASHTKRMSNESDLQYFKRLTHIYLQEKNIEEIVSIMYIPFWCFSRCKLKIEAQVWKLKCTRSNGST